MRKKIKCVFCNKEISSTLDPYGWWIVRKHYTKWQIVDGNLLIHNRPVVCEGSHVGYRKDMMKSPVKFGKDGEK